MKHVEDIRALIELLVTSKNFHSLVVEGAPGWGKSSATEKILLEKKLGFKTLGSYTTPLRLFQFLQENSKNLLVIDDCAGIFGDAIAMSILKAATWPSSGSEGTRLVAWGTTSEKVEQQEFFFDGKIILLTNSLPASGDGAAFSSRSLHYCVAPSPTDMEELVWTITRSGSFSDLELANEVASHLIETGRMSDFHGVNLRTLQLGYELASLGKTDWKTLFSRVLPSPDPKKMAFVSATGKHESVEEQFKEFHKATGLSRRTFFYYRARS